MSSVQAQQPYKPASKQSSTNPNNITELQKCREFMINYIDEETQTNTYQQQLQNVANYKSNVITINCSDISRSMNDIEFVSNIHGNTLRYVQLFSKVIDELMPNNNELLDETALSAHEIYQRHREARYRNTVNEAQSMNEQQGNNQSTNNDEIKLPFPDQLNRRYELYIIPDTTLYKVQNMRDIKAASVGHLVSVSGIVTRVSDVQPLVQVVTYICQVCGFESYQPVNDKTFTPLSACPSPACKQNQSSGKIIQQTRGSKFIRYQLVKLQELPHQVPVGHVPRSMTLRLEGSITRSCKPGDYCTVHGIYLPTPFTGFRAIKAGLTTETYIQVTQLISSKKSFKDTVIGDEMNDEITVKSQESGIFDQLAQSIAPEIYGHLDIKKALILLLAGGVTRNLSDGLKIRGDINCLLVGDPGVAKSQLLKHIEKIAPRCVYTTGKGSSGVGLTAAVLRDPVTGDMTLEGGALVLADMGICCIDEFDKMEEADRTAIHEVMEQQTVSIAKAGITTTLNARTSIIAAANPVWGRYKPKATVEENIGLPTALLSRFDLTFIILDQPDIDNDEDLAKHITYVHQHNKPPELSFTPFTAEFIRAYISRAKLIEPVIPREITDYIVGSYVGLRKENSEDRNNSNTYSQKNTRTRFCTARMLLSILRLSQALARIQFRSVVTRDDCEEAIRLLYVSKTMDDNTNKQNKKIDFLSEIYDIIRRYAQSHKIDSISRAEIRNNVVKRGYSDEQLQATLDEYDQLGIWQAGSSHIRFMTHIE